MWTFHFLCSSGSDYRKAPPTVDLNQFICTEKIRYLGEFDLGSDNSSSEDEAESFGQEFYLGNSILYTPEWKLTTVNPQERSTWRSGVRSAMRAASQLPGKGPTDVDDAPAPAR